MSFGSRVSRPVGLALVVFAAAAAIGSSFAIASSTASRRVVKAAEAESGQTVLANLRGRTLYSLSVEVHGKFICTGTCLSAWHPLVVPKRVRPTGPVNLGTVRRPDGRLQVTYRGRPLYSFSGDSKMGEGNGEGIKDVGTWHVASASGAAGSPAAPSEPAYPTYPPTTQPTAPQPSPPTTTPPPKEENPYPYPYPSPY